jgi:hypothetical protein
MMRTAVASPESALTLAPCGHLDPPLPGRWVRWNGHVRARDRVRGRERRAREYRAVRPVWRTPCSRRLLRRGIPARR